MSKITINHLTRSGTGCFIAVPIWQQWASKGQMRRHNWNTQKLNATSRIIVNEFVHIELVEAGLGVGDRSTASRWRSARSAPRRSLVHWAGRVLSQAPHQLLAVHRQPLVVLRFFVVHAQQSLMFHTDFPTSNDHCHDARWMDGWMVRV